MREAFVTLEMSLPAGQTSRPDSLGLGRGVGLILRSIFNDGRRPCHVRAAGLRPGGTVCEGRSERALIGLGAEG